MASSVVIVEPLLCQILTAGSIIETRGLQRGGRYRGARHVVLAVGARNEQACATSMKAFRPTATLALLVSAITITHCSSDDTPPPTPPPCVENLNMNCKVLHDPPLYSKIYPEIIQPQCTVGSSCHSTDAAMGGLVLANADDTYDTLLGLKGGTKRVLPRDPACSPLMVRLESRDPNFVMPKGSRLSDAALCDFIQWIKEGAPKN
jgi:cytochrome c